MAILVITACVNFIKISIFMTYKIIMNYLIFSFFLLGILLGIEAIYHYFSCKDITQGDMDNIYNNPFDEKYDFF